MTLEIAAQTLDGKQRRSGSPEHPSISNCPRVDSSGSQAPGARGVHPYNRVTPRFESAGETPSQVTWEHLAAPAVESQPHPSLPPERPVAADAHALEMRVYWGEVLLDLRHYQQGRRRARVTIGENRRADVFLSSEELPVELFPLIRFEGPQTLLCFTEGMTGEVESGGRVSTLAACRAHGERDSELHGVWRLPLPLDARVVLHWGGKSFTFRFVPPARAIPIGWARLFDLPYLNTVVVSLVVHLMAMVALLVHPYNLGDFEPDLFEHRPIVELCCLTMPPVQPLPESPPEPEPPKPVVAEVSPRSQVHRTHRFPDFKPRPVSAEQRRRDLASRFGKMLGDGLGGMPKLLQGAGAGLDVELARHLALPGAKGPTAGARGFEAAGGDGMGVPWGTTRIVDRIDTGLGPGGPPSGARPTDCKYRDKRPACRRAAIGRPGSAPIDLGPVEVHDALPRSVIDRVIRQNRGQIRYCYERQLQLDENLEGRVEVAFIIGATGAVAQAKILHTTMNNREVEHCMVKKILSWRFPKPQGGGTVRVNYPFVLRAE